MQELQHDLNDLEVQIGAIKEEKWALNSDRYQDEQKQKMQNYYDGETENGDYDGLIGIARRKCNGKNSKLGTDV